MAKRPPFHLSGHLSTFIAVGHQFQVWDLGGQTSIRPYWRCYYPNTDAIVFVVDSADVERMNVTHVNSIAPANRWQ